ncbi:DtxR family iron (metal) dependent repressor [Propionibacteriaceae bacterium ES.041]|uniref:Manganese transport regulator n=2 Tax=Enemella evansiae TaxID=2016499 RepID=A0A255GF01_9ACTN|nr:metal-binding protein [Enemella evansiae]PFG65508.1 DtxR family iron (metal) dependent repressor [Propionibacteriaceae bacterium ES.041]OYO01793.1 metal-binding protein [Enemella evansiae]OYO06782.1 metal-binding protein [Enemella evansiae]OYO11031.1 metal-binding protein [Enemella evansiae]
MTGMPHPAVTRVVEDYVTLIWKAHEWPGGTPTTSDLAAQLGVTPSTVSANLKKLARDGFLDYEPYGSISLTEPGRAIAVEIVRRHRILETYLVRELGVPWDQVHDEADRLEHAVSDLVLDRMDDVLGHPSHDPHGDPIPDRDGNLTVTADQALSQTAPGDRVRVIRVSDRSPEVLRHLEGLHVTVGTGLQVEEVNEAADAIRVTVGDDAIHLSWSTANAIRVAPEG